MYGIRLAHLSVDDCHEPTGLERWLKLRNGVCLLAILLLSCTTTTVATQQNHIIDLSIQCEDGNIESCDALPGAVNKLDKMLEN